ncbi:checkpoint protein kinase (SldA), putative [Cordyceps militaris CM01]|uniref:Checkpoint protein kinase (SldA), putative n=1 Tax=Cordyceps militaris (strain CM01) TaxID=983644 RepID=G3JN59_CORMM|nr:checkpoint protein kinase (SldA), putative [Cordyceps militaris CM01]EGX90241.1 checkpoint protein kinase (SldA), putative [Cordyceps militaris CM01]
MAPSEELINFDVIEGQKENIQSLPGGRSAKKLHALYSPTALQGLSTPTPPSAKNVNDCIRAEYEAEVQNISESDDPLDVYDRYVRWTLDAYPSAQATPQSQLHTLLERATKAFIGSPQYKNDPRYLKLWLHYIQFFADSPRETYMFLSRHGIGEGLALFYEEYAAWLESAGRWAQSEEVYKLGIEREARPVQRLLRKFKEFEERQAQTPEAADVPSSPALPSIRPALAAKVDPFAAAAAAARADPQATRPTGTAGGSSKPAKSKLSIFSDTEAKPSALSSREEGSKGWETIGSLADRKKENTMEARPWVGETLKAGGKKPVATARMAVFRDTSLAQIQNIVVLPSKHQVTVHPQTGKKEYIFVDLAAIYPTPDDPGTEVSFEEIMAATRGWLDCAWEDEKVDERPGEIAMQLEAIEEISKLAIHRDTVMYDENGVMLQHSNVPKPSKKKKFMEVNETQIIKAKLDSPSRPKIKKRNTSEPTMTLHTRAATDDIYDIFNAPIKPIPENLNESADEYEYESDGEYTTDAESTVATRIIEPSENGDEEMTDVKSLSEWSDFSTRKHAPDTNGESNYASDATNTHNEIVTSQHLDPTTNEEMVDEVDGQHATENSPPQTRTVFVPIPPEDWEPPTRPYRDAAEVANNRLPFMTPITERTEVSLDLEEDYENRVDHFKTPCRRENYQATGPFHTDLEFLSSPLREIVEDDFPVPKISTTLRNNFTPLSEKTAKPLPRKGPIIKDVMCNPMDENVRKEILANIQPPLSSYSGFYDQRHDQSERSGAIRKFIKALNSKPGKSNGERGASLPPQVVLDFANVEASYTLKRELGAGAFAPVYLVCNSNPEDAAGDENAAAVMGKSTLAVSKRAGLEALKMESPPSPWEFYMMRLSHSRLGPQHRVSASLSHAHELHLYRDEAFLFLPYHPNGTLLDVVNYFRTESSGVMDELLAMFFTIELFRTVEGLHAKQLCHGDLKADNCLLRLDELSSNSLLANKWRADGGGGWAARGVTLIDFGRGIDMRAFVPHVEFFADWKTTDQDCSEMREARPWTWQIDYYGLASTIHCFLYGKYIETVRCDSGGIGKGRKYRIREGLKRYWQTDIWSDCFEVLLNPSSFVAGEEGGAMPVLKSMKRVRERMQTWLETNSDRGVGLKGLIVKLENYVKLRK